MTRNLRIGRHTVGPDHPPIVVAEISGNHGGSLDGALDLVRAAAAAGAHAVKLQTYRPETMTTPSDRPDHRMPLDHPIWPGRTLWELYEEAHTPIDWHAPIFALAAELGIDCFSAPFDRTAVELLESLDAPAHKIASSELVDLPLIRAAAQTGKPVILSTAMASLAEIDAAVRTVRSTGNEDVVVLVCAPGYPADPAALNLRSLPVLAGALGVPVGLSDHTPGIAPAVAAVALGAVVVEKHLTLSREHAPIDSAFSLTPAELAQLVRSTHAAWQALGDPKVGAPTEPEVPGRRFRRSLRVTQSVRPGDPVTTDNIRSLRPAGGLKPHELELVVGRTFTRAAEPGDPLTWNLI